MPFAWFVALRYLRDAKAQTAMILAAVAVGVGVTVFLSALIGGLQSSLIEKTLGSQAHVILHVPREAPRALVNATPDLAVARITLPASQRLRSIDGWPALMGEIEVTAGVTSVSPMIVGAGVAVRADAKEAIVIRGVDPERFVGIIDLRKKMVSGRFDVSGARVVIGSSLAQNLNAAVGDSLRVSTTEGTEDVVVVAGVFSLGNEAPDKTWLVTSLRHAQALYGLRGGATIIELKLADVFAADGVARRLRDRTGLHVDSWMGLNTELLAGLSAQSSSKTLIQSLVVLAVALGIASVLAVSVVQKSREIGILRAVGTAARRVRAVFLIQGGVLGLLGSVIGAGLGVGLSKAFEGLARAADGTPKFPVQLGWSLVASAMALATGVGLLSAVVPAIRASRIDPAVAIRNG